MDDKIIIAIAVLNKLETLDKRKEKEALLHKFKDNDVLKDIFSLSFGDTRYYVRPKLPETFTPSLTAQEAWNAFLMLLDRLRTRTITGKKAKEETSKLLSVTKPKMAKWFVRIMLHDLRVGVAAQTISNIWPDVFKRSEGDIVFRGCALAKKYSDIESSKLTWPMAGEPKLDGERALIFVSGDNVYVFTRSGKRRDPIEQSKRFVQQILQLASVLPENEVFLDGEFLAKDWNSTSKIIRRTKNFDEDKFLSDVCLYVWDWLPYEDYVNSSAKPWKDRKTSLFKAIGADKHTKTIKFSDNIAIIGHRILRDEKTAMLYYEKMVDNGFEGIMLKSMEAGYEVKRTKDILKVKPEDEDTATIVEVVCGKGKHAEADKETVQTVLQTLKKYGKVKKTDIYLICEFNDSSKCVQVAKKLRKIIGDSTDRRLTVKNNRIYFRYGPRLGYFMAVTSNGDKIRIGGGIKDKEREQLWKNRSKLVGKKIDYISQSDPNKVAVGRFNRFVRLRDDL